jgi:rod shape-determining protein MreD
VKWLSVAAVVAASVALQMGFARFTVGERWSADLVLVGVAFVALKWGPTAGVVGGSLGGLTQDALANAVLGVSGLAKTICGFLIGVIGSQFIVARPAARSLVVCGASVLNRLVVAAVVSAITQRWSGPLLLDMLGETALNGLIAFVLFQSIETVPGLWGRRGRRRAFGARKW